MDRPFRPERRRVVALAVILLASAASFPVPAAPSAPDPATSGSGSASGTAAAVAATPAAGIARAEALRTLVARVEARYRGLPPFKVAFTQRYKSVTFGSEDEARGTVHVVPPSRMLWTYEVPKGQRGALDGNSYWLVVPEDRQVIVRNRPEGAADPLTELLAGRLALAKVFAIDLAEGARPASGRVVLVLTPRDPREDVDRALLEVEERDGSVRRLEVLDPLGNRMVFVLGEPVPARPPPPAAFRMEVPDGYAVTGE